MELLAITEEYLSLGDSIAQRARAVADGGVPLQVMIYRRILALDSMYREKSFEKLIPVLIGFHESSHFGKGVKADNIDLYATGSIPTLPTDYWNDAAAWLINSQAILAASIVSYASTPLLVPPVSTWHDELAHIACPPRISASSSVLCKGRYPKQTISIN